MRNSRAIVAFLLAFLLFVPSTADARRKRRSNSATSAHTFDYYVLAMSWAPNFCATRGTKGNFRECGIGRRVGFVIHGLWPQGESGRLPRDCRDTSPLARDVVERALEHFPNAGLVQHEWECHGHQSGLPAREYFEAANRAFSSITIPERFRSMSQPIRDEGDDIAREFVDANRAPAGSFVTSCAKGSLVAVQACFTKDLKLRPCGEGLRSCSTELLVRAPR